MKLAEKILAILAVTGLLLKFSLIGGGDELFMFSLLTLSSIYFAFGFLLFNQIRLRDLTKKGTFENLAPIRIVFGVLAGIALSIVCVGTLFKLLSLPGAGEMLMFGVVTAILILTAVFVLRGRLAAAPILMRTLIFGSLGTILFFISTLSIIKLQYRNHPAYIEAYKQYEEDPQNESLWTKKELEYQRIWMTEEEIKEYEQSQ